MHLLGIDFGTRRIGLSHADEIGVALPLPALVDADEPARLERLAAIIRERRVTGLVLGYPYNLDGSAGFKAKEVEAFAEKLKARFGLPVHFVDETLTSYEAEGTIARKDRRQDRTSGRVDSRAACLILQDYLDQARPLPGPESPG